MSRYGLKIALASTAFFVVTSLTIAFSRFDGGLALLWPGTAIVTALLISLPKSLWLRASLIAVGLSFVATSLFGFGPGPALPLALINTGEACAIAAMMVLFRPQRDWLESVRGLECMLFSIVAGSALSAIPGGLVAALAVDKPVQLQALDWLTAHSLGSLLCLPLALLICSGALAKKIRLGTRRDVIEMVLHCIVIAGVSWVAFFQAEFALLYLPVAPLLYAAFRRGRLGASLGLLVIAAAGAISMHSDIGYFPHSTASFASAVQQLQLYLAVLMLLAMPTSVALQNHKLLLAELQEKRALESLIADHSDDALINLDREGTVRYASPAALRLYGSEGAVGVSLTSFYDPLDEAYVRACLTRAAENPTTTCVFERAVLHGGEAQWLETKLRAVPEADGDGAISGYAVTIRDVTARKRDELDARREAETDALTGLPNRRALMRHLEPRLEKARHRPLALAIVDLDHFKVINDTHGHVAGDLVLRRVAAEMRKVGGNGLFFARLGGEEFALVVEQEALPRLMDTLESLRSAIAGMELEGPEGESFICTASIGVARLTDAITPSEALRAADTPLYAAKANGRNRIEVALERTRERRELRAVRAA